MSCSSVLGQHLVTILSKGKKMEKVRYCLRLHFNNPLLLMCLKKKAAGYDLDIFYFKCLY